MRRIPAAVRRIFEAKGRPTTHPVIVHLDSPRYPASLGAGGTGRRDAHRGAFLARSADDGDAARANVHDIVTGGQDTVAVRVPSHPMAQQLLTAFGGGIAAPSANRYGRLSPDARGARARRARGAVRVILDGGECQIGLESTIVAFEGQNVRLLRPGAVTASQMRGVVGELLVGADLQSPRVPGSTPSHYAPMTPMAIVPSGEIDAQAAALSEGGRRIAVLAQRLPLKRTSTSPGSTPAGGPSSMGTISTPTCARSTRQAASRFWCRRCREDERWDAARDRLLRAASQHQRQRRYRSVAVLP